MAGQLRFDPTYKELKPRQIAPALPVELRFDPTYKELKPSLLPGVPASTLAF